MPGRWKTRTWAEPEAGIASRVAVLRGTFQRARSSPGRQGPKRPSAAALGARAVQSRVRTCVLFPSIVAYATMGVKKRQLRSGTHDPDSFCGEWDGCACRGIPDRPCGDVLPAMVQRPERTQGKSMPRVPKSRRVWKPVAVECPVCTHTLVAGVDTEVEILRWNHADVVSGGFECPGCGVRLVVRRWYQTVEVTSGSVVGEARRGRRGGAQHPAEHAEHNESPGNPGDS